VGQVKIKSGRDFGHFGQMNFGGTSATGPADRFTYA